MSADKNVIFKILLVFGRGRAVDHTNIIIVNIHSLLWPAYRGAMSLEKCASVTVELWMRYISSLKIVFKYVSILISQLI